VFQGRGERRNKLIRQRVKEQFPDERDMAWRGGDYGAQTLLRQDRIRRSAVVFGLDAFREATLAESPQLVRNPTALPSDYRGQIGDL
jgi:hypothetical protein